jgi:hypothetical protein
VADEFAPNVASRSTGILWGMSKVGKTTFLMSLPGRILYVMIDPDGDESLPILPERITVIKLYTYKDDEIIRLLEKKIPAHIEKNHEEFDSVVIDSLSTIGRIALEDAIAKGVGNGREFTASIEAPGLAAYGSRTNHTLKIVNMILRATARVGKHCWFTSHEDEPKTNQKGDLLYITMTQSGKTINGMGLQVSEIWYMRFHDKKWFIAIAPCRNKQPMGSRMFDVTGEPEFRLVFDPELGPDQPHSIATWFNRWQGSGRKKLPVPRTKE